MTRRTARIFTELTEIEELESKAHLLWDDSFSNLRFGRLSDEMKEKYLQQTYQATELHAQAQEKVRSLSKLMTDILAGDAARDNEEAETFHQVNALFLVKLAEKHPDHPWLNTQAARENTALLAEVARLRALLAGRP